MNFKHLVTITFLGLLSWQVSAQESESISIYDFDNKEEFTHYKQLNLDKDHPNLLNPAISKDDMTEVIGSWTELHQNIGKYLNESGFEWGVDDPEVMILHKFYFEPDGKIKTYFFRIFNEEVSDAQRENYSKLISEFAKTHRIAITKDAQFAQCGKSKYVNP